MYSYGDGKLGREYQISMGILRWFGCIDGRFHLLLHIRGKDIYPTILFIFHILIPPSAFPIYNILSSNSLRYIDIDILSSILPFSSLLFYSKCIYPIYLYTVEPLLLGFSSCYWRSIQSSSQRLHLLVGVHYVSSLLGQREERTRFYQ